MPTIPVTKADLVRAIDTESDWWRAVLDQATASGPLSGDEEIDGNWTFKELLAHVIGWRTLTLARLEAAADGTGAPTPPWPAGMTDETDEGTDEINAWFSAQSHRASLAEVAGQMETQLAALRGAIERIPDDDLFTPGRFASIDPAFAQLPLGPALIGYSIEHVHGEHAPALEAWLDANRGQHVELPPIPSNFGYDY